MSQEKMNTFFQKNKIIIIVLSSFLFFGAALYYGGSYLFGLIRVRSDSIQQAKLDAQIDQSRLGRIPEMDEAYQNYESNRNSLESVVDPSKEVELIKEIEVMADETGNKIKLRVLDDPNDKDTDAKKPVPTKKKSDETGIMDKLAYKKYIIMEIALVGDYGSLVRFMHKFENMQYWANITAVNSKKVTAEELAETSMQSGGLFSSPSGPGGGNDDQENKDEKEYLASTLSVIIYMKK